MSGAMLAAKAIVGEIREGDRCWCAGRSEGLRKLPTGPGLYEPLFALIEQIGTRFNAVLATAHQKEFVKYPSQPTRRCPPTPRPADH